MFYSGFSATYIILSRFQSHTLSKYYLQSDSVMFICTLCRHFDVAVSFPKSQVYLLLVIKTKLKTTYVLQNKFNYQLTSAWITLALYIYKLNSDWPRYWIF